MTEINQETQDAGVTAERGMKMLPTHITPEQSAMMDIQANIEEQQTEDFKKLNAEQFINGTQQLMEDRLTRLLQCKAFISDPSKQWDKDYKGRPAAMMFYREFPERQIMVDSFPKAPKEEELEKRKYACGIHGYLYIYGTPSQPLNSKALEEQLTEGARYLKRLAASFGENTAAAQEPDETVVDVPADEEVAPSDDTSEDDSELDNEDISDVVELIAEPVEVSEEAAKPLSNKAKKAAAKAAAKAAKKAEKNK